MAMQPFKDDEFEDDDEPKESLPWPVNTKRRIDATMRDKDLTPREKTRRVCEYLFGVLSSSHGTVHKHSTPYPAVEFTPAGENKPISLSTVLMQVGIIPSDPLYKAVDAYFMASLHYESRRK